MSSVLFNKEVLPGHGEVCRDCRLNQRRKGKKICICTNLKVFSPDGNKCTAKKKKFVVGKEKSCFSLAI